MKKLVLDQEKFFYGSLPSLGLFQILSVDEIKENLSLVNRIPLYPVTLHPKGEYTTLSTALTTAFSSMGKEV